MQVRKWTCAYLVCGDINLNGGVATAVKNLTGVDLLNRHGDVMVVLMLK